MKKVVVILFLATVSCFYSVYGANILGLSLFDSVSHFKVIHPVFVELANRGHNVTVISFKEEENLPENYRLIKIEQFSEDMYNEEDTENNNNFFIDLLQSNDFLMYRFFIWDMFMQDVKLTLNSTAVQNFIKDDSTKFDLIICEDFNFVPFYMFAHKYKAPLITYSTYGNIHHVNEFMGNPLDLQYVAQEFLPFAGKLTLWQKIENVLSTYGSILVKTFYYMPKYKRLAEQYFSGLPQPLPDLRDIEKNISLHLINTHFAVDTVRSLLPNMVEIGGVHLQETKPLPKDLKLILDNATKGAVYFSLGSNLKSSDLPAETIAAFLQAFSKLNQTVIWKFEDDDLPGKPDNILIRKWLPQSDILAHPNVRAFITHGGILSIQESLRRGIPLIGIPSFGDQPGNIAKAKAAGYGEYLGFDKLDLESISEALNKVLNDPSYLRNAKEASRRFHDRQFTAMQTAIYWIEYVIRYKGAYHMKTPSSFMSWYEFYLLDVIAILSIAVVTVLLVHYFILMLILKTLFSKGHKQIVRVNNKKNM